jgi:putative ABC transport system substrate-binding protein
MITRRIFLASAAALATRPTAAAERVFRIGLLWAGSDDNPWIKFFVEELSTRGYVLGKNLAFEMRAAGGDANRLTGLTADLLALRPDVILVSTTASVMALAKQQSTVPVVFVIGVDPVERLKVAQSLSHPGGSFTGLFNNAGDVLPKSLQMLRDLLPQARRVGSLSDPSFGPVVTAAGRAQMTAAAERLGVEFETIELNSGEELPSAFDRLAELKVDAFLGTGGPFSNQHRSSIIELVRAHRWPAIYPFRADAAEGGLMSYGSDMDALFRSAAGYVDRILQGAHPADLPIEQATKLILVINMKTARELSLEIPQLLLANATELIE